MEMLSQSGVGCLDARKKRMFPPDLHFGIIPPDGSVPHTDHADELPVRAAHTEELGVGREARGDRLFVCEGSRIAQLFRRIRDLPQPLRSVQPVQAIRKYLPERLYPGQVFFCRLHRPELVHTAALRDRQTFGSIIPQAASPDDGKSPPAPGDKFGVYHVKERAKGHQSTERPRKRHRAELDAGKIQHAKRSL